MVKYILKREKMDWSFWIFITLVAGLSIICETLIKIHQTLKEKLTGISYDINKLREHLER